MRWTKGSNGNIILKIEAIAELRYSMRVYISSFPLLRSKQIAFSAEFFLDAERIQKRMFYFHLEFDEIDANKLHLL